VSVSVEIGSVPVIASNKKINSCCSWCPCSPSLSPADVDYASSSSDDDGEPANRAKTIGLLLVCHAPFLSISRHSSSSALLGLSFALF
jgi:hypothetical protein